MRSHWRSPRLLLPHPLHSAPPTRPWRPDTRLLHTPDCPRRGRSRSGLHCLGPGHHKTSSSTGDNPQYTRTTRTRRTIRRECLEQYVVISTNNNYRSITSLMRPPFLRDGFVIPGSVITITSHPDPPYLRPGPRVPISWSAPGHWSLNTHQCSLSHTSWSGSPGPGTWPGSRVGSSDCRKLGSSS